MGDRCPDIVASPTGNQKQGSATIAAAADVVVRVVALVNVQCFSGQVSIQAAGTLLPGCGGRQVLQPPAARIRAGAAGAGGVFCCHVEAALEACLLVHLVT